ncbi:pentapeptide repeat-containing protein [Streptomyces sp. AGS-58]|uniref:pentapeptide repeat-containing protein n=1 Tax=unclassified Streptomyces TaxID=2593676 RepID=UPI0035A37D4B
MSWWTNWNPGERAWFVFLAISGVLLLLGAWIMSQKPKDSGWRVFQWLRHIGTPDGDTRVGRTGLVAGLGAGILTSLAVTFTLFAVQYSLQKSQDEATWKSGIATAWNLPGFELDGHQGQVNGMNFSGKQMHDADFRKAHLRDAGVKFEDAMLENSHFEEADLRGVDFLGAHLSGSEFAGVDLGGADLRSADLSHTTIAGAKSISGALVNSQTCWPHGFMSSQMFKKAQLHKTEWHDPANNRVYATYGQEWPACGEKM